MRNYGGIYNLLELIEGEGYIINKIYETILIRKIENFVGLFAGDSNSIFKNSDSKLIHPGEYGKYREKSCKDILKLLLKTDCEVSDGFIFTADNHISTQCDIIIYNSDLSPLITNDIANMFPVEEVRMIGEIKSNLGKASFKDTLIKLSKNKALYKNRKGIPDKKPYSKENYNSIISFLICNKLEFNYNEINLTEIYGDIPREEWHNAILSIEDGVIMYALDFRECSPETIELLKNKKYNIEQVGNLAYPNFFINNELVKARDNFIEADSKKKYHHIIRFFVNIVKCTKEVWVYKHDPVVYLGLNTKPFFNE